MVANSGKTLRVSAYKPVNLPEPLAVEESSLGEPVAVKLPLKQAVASTEDRWRIDDEWWRSQPISRLYYAILFASGQRLVVYKDLNCGQWYKQVY